MGIDVGADAGADVGADAAADAAGNPPTKVAAGKASISAAELSTDLPFEATSSRRVRRVCIYGAGAVGGYLAARFSTVPGIELSLIARGPHLAAIRAHGLQVRDKDAGDATVHPFAATDHPHALPPQDLVIVTLKSTALASAAEGIASLLAATHSRAIFVTNGIPWWWNHGLPAENQLPGAHPVDPDGALWRHVTPDKAIGCVALSSNRVEAPGVVVHAAFNQWKLGLPRTQIEGMAGKDITGKDITGKDIAGKDMPGERTIRVGHGKAPSAASPIDDIVALWRSAGLNVDASNDLRGEIWRKLLVNIPNHSLGSLTRLGTDDIYRDPQRIALARTLLEEVVAIAAAHGWDLGADAVDRTLHHFQPKGTGARPSMLQDVEAGRPLEVAAVFDAVRALARCQGVTTPALDIVTTLLGGLNEGMTSATRRAPPRE
nr:ketopantoate reductase C-terminal domain-containing protein [Pigmentiphaga litoralis]